MVITRTGMGPGQESHDRSPPLPRRTVAGEARRAGDLMSGKANECNYQLNFKMASRKDHKILLEEWEMPTKWWVQNRVAGGLAALCPIAHEIRVGTEKLFLTVMRSQVQPRCRFASASAPVPSPGHA